MPLGMEVGLGPGNFVLDGNPAPPEKRARPTHNFSPMSILWLNAWIYQDATWYEGKPRPRRRCVRWGRSSPLKGTATQFSAHVYCGKTAGWVKTPLGREVDLS